jgi:hypothetical protein
MLCLMIDTIMPQLLKSYCIFDESYIGPEVTRHMNPGSNEFLVTFGPF